MTRAGAGSWPRRSSLESEKVKNVTPRYARMKAKSGEVIGWENIELISDRPLEVMLEDFGAAEAGVPRPPC